MILFNTVLVSTPQYALYWALSFFYTKFAHVDIDSESQETAPPFHRAITPNPPPSGHKQPRQPPLTRSWSLRRRSSKSSNSSSRGEVSFCNDVVQCGLTWLNNTYIFYVPPIKRRSRVEHKHTVRDLLYNYAKQYLGVFERFRAFSSPKTRIDFFLEFPDFPELSSQGAQEL